MRTLVILFFVFSLSTVCFGQQSPQWEMVGGKARLQKIIPVEGKDADYIYLQVNRWLVATYRNPEDVLKARIEKEFLKGEGYHRSLFQIGAMSAGDFQYTFLIDIKDEKLRITLTNGVLVYDFSDFDYSEGAHTIEQYLHEQAKQKKDTTVTKALESVNTFSHSLLKSLETYLTSETNHRAEGW